MGTTVSAVGLGLEYLMRHFLRYFMCHLCWGYVFRDEVVFVWRCRAGS